MIVTNLYAFAQYMVDEDGNKKAVLDWRVWKDVLSLLKNLEGREADLTIRDTLKGEAPLNITPDAE